VLVARAKKSFSCCSDKVPNASSARAGNAATATTIAAAADPTQPIPLNDVITIIPVD